MNSNLVEYSRYRFIMKDGDIYEATYLKSSYGMYNYELFEVETSDCKSLFLREDRIDKIEVI